MKLSRALSFDLRSPRALADGFRCYLNGESGSGKSSATALIVEQVLAAGEQVIVLDPHEEYGNLWGVNPAAVVRAGYGDQNVNVDSVDWCLEVVESGKSLLLDLSHWALMIRERDAFVLAFIRGLYQMRTRKPKFTLLVIEEASNFCGQQQITGQAENVSAFVTIVTEGRKFGLNVVLTSQAASLVDYRVLKGSNVKLFMRVSDFAEWKRVRPHIPTEMGIDFKGRHGIKYFESGEALVISRWAPECRVRLLKPSVELRKAIL